MKAMAITERRQVGEKAYEKGAPMGDSEKKHPKVSNEANYVYLNQ